MRTRFVVLPMLLAMVLPCAAAAIDETKIIDHGPSKDFIVHQIINGAGKPGFENMANLDRVPPVGATLIALPVKIEGGSGAPMRAVAILP